MSLLNEQINVRSTDQGTPDQFIWRGRTFRVRRIIGDWPARPEASGARRTGVHLLRVSAESDSGEPSIIELTRDTTSNRWTMRRQWN